MVETAHLVSGHRQHGNLTQDGAGSYCQDAKEAVITLIQDGGGDLVEPRERLCPSPRWRPPWALSLAPPPRAPPRLPRPSHRPLAVPSSGGGARAKRAGSRHLTWRYRRQLQRAGGMGVAGAGPGPAKPAARGRRRARGLWPRRTWSSTMW